MKRYLAVGLSILFLTPSIALAAQFRQGNTTVVASGETINDDLYIAGGTVTIDGTVNGDLIVAGGTVKLNGVVNGDVQAAGGTVTIAGTVQDDVRAAGGQVTVDGTVAHDLLLGGGSILLTEKATVTGDTKLAGGEVTLAGKTGSIDASTGMLSIEKTAVVTGNLRYWSDKEAKIADGATVSGNTEKHLVDMGQKKMMWQGTFSSALFGLLAMALFAWLMSLIFPNKIEAIVTELASSGSGFGRNLLWGFLVLALAPILAIILMMTVIGIPAGLLILALYPVLIGLGCLVATLTTGFWVYRALSGKSDQNTWWLYAIIGAVLLTLIKFVPYLGGLLGFIIFLASFGGLIRFDWLTYQKLRDNKTL